MEGTLWVTLTSQWIPLAPFIEYFSFNYWELFCHFPPGTLIDYSDWPRTSKKTFQLSKNFWALAGGTWPLWSFICLSLVTYCLLRIHQIVLWVMGAEERCHIHYFTIWHLLSFILLRNLPTFFFDLLKGNPMVYYLPPVKKTIEAYWKPFNHFIIFMKKFNVIWWSYKWSFQATLFGHFLCYLLNLCCWHF